jgi:hypothetical protein
MNLKELAEIVRTSHRQKYNLSGLEYFENSINRKKEKNEIIEPDKVEWYAAFLGQTVIENYGGFWDYEEYDEGKEIVVRFDESNIFRAFMVTEKFCSGEWSSYSGIYTEAMKDRTPLPKKKPWWKF